MKQLQDMEFSVGAVTTRRLLVPPNSSSNYTSKHKRNVSKMKMQGKDATADDPVALLLKSGVYLDFALPVPPPDEVLSPKVSDLVSQMSPLERLKAKVRLTILAAYVNAMQSALTKANESHSEQMDCRTLKHYARVLLFS